MAVSVGQVYRDRDSRSQGRTMKVSSVQDDYAELEILTNADDIQALLDDPDNHPGTRSYTPKDRRGDTTRIKVSRLESRAFEEVEQPPNVTGPV